MSDTREILTERGKRYGAFSQHARITETLQQVMFAEPSYLDLKPFQREALRMIAHKIGRIVNGDPNYDDSWKDIAGYAQLVVDILNNKEAESK